MIRKIAILVIAIIVMFVIMPTISLADTNTDGVVTLDNEDGDINPGELQSRVESTGITNASEVLELHIGTDVSGEFNDIDIAYINTLVNLQVLDVASTITVGYVGDNFCASFDNLKEITFPATNFGSNAFRSSRLLATISLPNATTFGEDAFRSCYFRSISLPNAITFGDFAFSNCALLRSISLPNAIAFGDYAFEECAAVVSISLPNATTFGDYAFYYCWLLESVNLPNATTFGSSTFAGVNRLASLTLGYNPPSVGGGFATRKDLYVPSSAVFLYKNDNDGNTSDNLWYGWTINSFSYTVEFDSQSGSLVPSQYITNDHYATKPINPTRDDYTFGGWYTDSACTDDNPWNFNLCSVNNDMTLYAKWIRNSISDLEFDNSYKALKLSITDSIETICPYSFYPTNVIDSTVSWESSNSSVASISNGMITANNEGRTVITITANDTTNGIIKTTMMLEVMDSSTTGLSSNKTNIIGNVVDSNGVALSNILVTTYSDPMDTLTDTASGAFSYSSVPFTHHTMVISDDNGIEIGRFTLDFNNTGNENIIIDNINNVATINFADSTYLVDFTIQINDTFTNINIIKSDIAGQEIFINPKTGDYNSNYIWMIILMPIFIIAYISIKNFTTNGIVKI